MVNNLTTIKKYEETKQDYEILAKLNLAMLLEYEEGMKDEEINQIINNEDWKEKFEISRKYEEVSWKGRTSFWHSTKPAYVVWRAEKKVAEEADKKLKEFIEKNKEQALKIEELNQDVKHWKERAERAEEDAEIHLLALEVSGGKVWGKPALREEIRNKSEKIEVANENLKKKDELISKLQSELEEKAEKLEEANKGFEKLKLEQKITEDSPLPKKQNRFKQVGRKIKTKLQQLVKKVKTQTRELIARIEVKVK